MSANPVPWLERTFEIGPTAGRDELAERLRSAPDRLHRLVAALPRDLLIRRDGDAWSIQEHAGHLLDLEDLHLARLRELAAGVQELRPADLSNRRTYEAHHHDDTIASILEDFRFAREVLVERCAAADPEHQALHPRLRRFMGALELMEFVAEHDDHHVRAIERLLETWSAGEGDAE